MMIDFIVHKFKWPLRDKTFVVYSDMAAYVNIPVVPTVDA